MIDYFAFCVWEGLIGRVGVEDSPPCFELSVRELPSFKHIPARVGGSSFLNRLSATFRSSQISTVALSTRLNRFAAVVHSRTEANGLYTTRLRSNIRY